MKIVFDATALYGRFGGIENALWQSFAGLRRLDDENEYLVCVPSDAPDPPAPPNPRWKWHRLPFRGEQKLRRIFWQQVELPLMAQRERADLLHCWNYVAPLIEGVPTLLTVTDLIALDRPQYATRPNRLHYRAIVPRSLKGVSGIVAPTPRGKSAILRRAPRADVRVVPLGVDDQFFQPISPEVITAIRQKYELPPRFLLYVGNFEPKKNLAGLLRALKMLPEAPPLVVVGGIKPWPGFEALLKPVRQLGFVPGEELPALYSACEAFCFPSLAEGFGLPVLEALACGAPVLASSEIPLDNLDSVAAMPDPRSVSSIAGHLQKLLSPTKSCETLAQRNRAFASPYTWENSARKLLSIYREFA